jgi:ubiquinone biosynthesis protein Coq4
MDRTVGEALTEFRKANGLTACEASPWWTCRLGPISIRLPNFKWRRKALLAHDLHHVLTGYPCGMYGEFQVAAWEFGAGPMPHWGATLFCLPLVAVGLCLTPRRVLRAFMAGRRSRSLHQSEAIDAVLAPPLSEARANLVLSQR